MAYLPKKKRAIVKYPVTILVDDREKKAWRLSPTKFKMKRIRLEVGDYTMQDYEDIVAIEKKENLYEFVQNISGADRERFRASLEKLSKKPFSYFVICDSPTNIGKALKRLPPNAKIDLNSVCYWINLIMVRYTTPVLFIGDRARIRQRMLDHLFTAIVENLNVGQRKTI